MSPAYRRRSAAQAPLLLFKAIKGKLADVKRLHVIRHCFYNFDLGDDESLDTVNNILRVAMSPVVLRSGEGRRLVAFFFDHCVELTQDLTHIIKNMIVMGQPYALDAYGMLPHAGQGRRGRGCTNEQFRLCLLRTQNCGRDVLGAS